MAPSPAVELNMHPGIGPDKTTCECRYGTGGPWIGRRFYAIVMLGGATSLKR